MLHRYWIVHMYYTNAVGNNNLLSGATKMVRQQYVCHLSTVQVRPVKHMNCYVHRYCWQLALHRPFVTT